MNKDIQQDMRLPLDRKMLLSIREAAEYSNIGIHKIDEILKQPSCLFVLFVGTKKLIKYKASESHIDGKVRFKNVYSTNWCAPKTSKHIETSSFLCYNELS